MPTVCQVLFWALMRAKMDRTRRLLLGSLAIIKRDEELEWLGRVVHAWKVNKTTEQAQK